VVSARHGLEVLLLPLSQAAIEALPEDGIVLGRFPFRIGRKPVDRASTDLSMNELEFAASYAEQVSRNHCAIDFDENHMVVRDRGSQRGTLVNDKAIGVGALQDVAPLKTGDNEIVLGAPNSPIRLVAIVKAS
jgi:pSer/pThr/pTyr-binding forkhead associated (FHA) protein